MNRRMLNNKQSKGWKTFLDFYPFSKIVCSALSLIAYGQVSGMPAAEIIETHCSYRLLLCLTLIADAGINKLLFEFFMAYIGQAVVAHRT